MRCWKDAAAAGRRVGGRASAVNHCQSVPSADAGVAVAVAGGVGEEKKGGGVAVAVAAAAVAVAVVTGVA